MLAEGERWQETSLRRSGDALPVDDVGAILGLAPEYVGRTGDHIKGNPRYTKHQTNIWTHRFTTETTVPFETQLAKAVTRLEVARDALAQLLRPKGVAGELCIGFGSGNGQGGFALSSDLLSRIGALGLEIWLDLYPPDVDRQRREGIERATSYEPSSVKSLDVGAQLRRHDEASS